VRQIDSIAVAWIILPKFPWDRSMATDVLQLWEAGEELNFAWFGFASEYEKEQYRNAGTRDRMEALSILMKADLVAKIQEEELYCFGLRIEPTLSEGPERIPTFLFSGLSKRGRLLENFDWEKSTLRSAGREYVQVRVSAPKESRPTDAQILSKKIGRPRIDEQLRAVVRELAESGLLLGKARKEQENIVREKARKQYPNLFPTNTRPSREKILSALKAEGFIGKNQKV
jgi:hypothetical protein